MTIFESLSLMIMYTTLIVTIIALLDQKSKK